MSKRSVSKTWSYSHKLIANPLFLTALGMPFSAFALGLGDIQIFSHLAQPLRAQIALHDVDVPLENLQVLVATNDELMKMGIEPNDSSVVFNLTPKLDENGHPVVTITTDTAIQEPYLLLYLQVTWPDGQITRQYPLLLDPISYDNTSNSDLKPAATAINTEQPQAQIQPAQAPVIATQAQATTPNPIPAQPITNTIPARTQVQAVTPKPVSTALDALPPISQTTAKIKTVTSQPIHHVMQLPQAKFGERYGPVQAGDSLLRIAHQLTHDPKLVAQLMDDIVSQNSAAFIHGNKDQLIKGQYLQIPEQTGETTAAIPTAAKPKPATVSSPVQPAVTNKTPAAPTSSNPAALNQNSSAIRTTSTPTVSQVTTSQPAVHPSKWAAPTPPLHPSLYSGKKESSSVTPAPVAPPVVQSEAENSWFNRESFMLKCTGLGIFTLIMGLALFYRRNPHFLEEITALAHSRLQTWKENRNSKVHAEESTSSQGGGVEPITLQPTSGGSDAVLDVIEEADIYLSHHRVEKAIQVLKQEFSMRPDRIDIAYKLAECYAESSNDAGLEYVMSHLPTDLAFKDPVLAEKFDFLRTKSVLAKPVIPPPVVVEEIENVLEFIPNLHANGELEEEEETT